MLEGREFAVLYAAKSSPDEKGSIPDQLREGREWAKEKGLKVLASHSEENVSAYKGDRGPELAKAMEHTERAGAVLVAQHSDRLARGDAKQARHLVEIALWAIKADVEIYCLQDPSTFENLLMAVVMGDRNMHDSKRKAAAVKAGLARRRRRGLVSGPAAYGYVLRRNKDDERRLVIDPHRAEVVRRIFNEYLAGCALPAISRGLTADGMTAALGGPWNPCSVRQLLMNPVYAALLRDGEELVEAAHEAIIPRETWEAAEALRKAKASTHKRGRNPKGKHLFRKGFLRCGDCGGSMVPSTHRKVSGNVHEYYRCLNSRNGLSSCAMSHIPRAKIDDPLYAYFQGLDLDIEATGRQMASATERKLAEARELHEQAQHGERESKARLKRVKHDYFNGDLTAEEWRELRADLELDFAGAKAETKRLAQRLKEAEDGTALLETQEGVLNSQDALGDPRGDGQGNLRCRGGCCRQSRLDAAL